jgi:N-acetylmuramoyl-L-alanine amidase
MAHDSLKTVIAEKGDRIFSLLQINDVSPYDYYDDFIKLNLASLRASVTFIKVGATKSLKLLWIVFS